MSEQDFELCGKCMAVAGYCEAHRPAERKSIYYNDGSYTSSANALSEEVWHAVNGIIRKYVEQGYNIREVAHVAQAAITNSELQLCLDLKGKV